MPKKNSPSRNYRNRGKSRKNIPYLGKSALFWCKSCNVPLIDKIPCAICQKEGKQVNISPPGDVRPAFQGDYQILRDIINDQFGLGIGDLIANSNHIILLNRIGGLDRTDQVILDGIVIGVLSFNVLNLQFEFIPRVEGGHLIFELQQHLKIPLLKQIWLNPDGKPYILNGKSILAPGVEKVSQDLKTDDYCMVIADIDSRPLCIAIALTREPSLVLNKMIKDNFGHLAKNNKYYKKKIDPDLIAWLDKSVKNLIITSQKSVSSNIFDSNKHLKLLNHVYQANITYLNNKIQKSMQFISQTVEKQQKPVAVAYSGGKDSLGVLMLVWKSLGPNFKIFFADTGLELPETLKNLYDVAKELNMEDKLSVKSAGDTFWKLKDDFGPPARDYRYCCHTLKAQNIMEIIETLYEGKKVLTFLGQRQYESLNRAKSELVYVNSFIPLQVAATPIKKWNALTLWLFLLFDPMVDPITQKPKKLSINPMYFKGHERMGCYLCPAASLASFELIKSTHPAYYDRWYQFLYNYADKMGLPKKWVEYGLWRFKKPSPQWQNLIKAQDLSYSVNIIPNIGDLNVVITKGFSPCLQSGYSIKGRFSVGIDMEKLNYLLPALCKNIDWDDELHVISCAGEYKRKKFQLNLFPDGTFFLRVDDQQFPYSALLTRIFTTVIRSLSCTLCKTCISVCPNHAIKIEENQLKIDPDKCTQCFQCITHCPFFTNAKTIMEKIKID